MEATSKETRKDYLNYLFSHIEFEHIELDCYDLIYSNDLKLLSLLQLRNMAYFYGF